jgi:MFS family permease
VSTGVIGFAFAINTAVIVGLQFFVLKRISGKRRTRVLIVMVALWSVAWVVLGLTGLVSGTWAAAAGVLLFHALFALGETLLQPTIPALVNELAPDHLRGRYNALSSGSFQLAAIIAPPIAGVMVDHGLSEFYIGSLVVGCLLCGAISVLKLEPQLSPEVNGVRSHPTASGELPPEAAKTISAATD